MYWLGRSAVVLHPRRQLSPALSEYTVRCGSILLHVEAGSGQAVYRTDSWISGGPLTAGAAVGTKQLHVLETEARTYSYSVGNWFDSRPYCICCPWCFS